MTDKVGAIRANMGTVEVKQEGGYSKCGTQLGVNVCVVKVNLKTAGLKIETSPANMGTVSEKNVGIVFHGQKSQLTSIFSGFHYGLPSEKLTY